MPRNLENSAVATGLAPSFYGTLLWGSSVYRYLPRLFASLGGNVLTDQSLGVLFKKCHAFPR